VAEALATRRVGMEIVSKYSSDSNVVPGYNSDSSYEFDFNSDPFESELSSTRPRNCCQVPLLAWSLHPLPPIDSSTGLTASPQT
jgi:hypothetical protein